MTDEPIGGPLVLPHASNRISGTWGPDDYDVMSGDRVIGRIFKARAGVPRDRPWQWSITGAVVMPHERYTVRGDVDGSADRLCRALAQVACAPKA